MNATNTHAGKAADIHQPASLHEVGVISTRDLAELTCAARLVKSRPALLTAAQAAREVYGVSERTFHDMRAKGLVPPAVELGPRLLRWHRNELEAAIAAFPRRAEALPVPAQLLRGKIDRMKAGAGAGAAPKR